jgi:hypothetical protein
MRGLVGLTLALTCGLSAGAAEPSRDSEIYVAALHVSLEAEAQAYSRIGEEMDSEVLVVADEPSLTEGLPTESGRFRVSLMDDNRLRDRFRREKKALAVRKLFRARLENGRLVVSINKYWFSYRKRTFGHPTYEWGLDGGATVAFEYDCDLRKYVLADVTMWGV